MTLLVDNEDTDKTARMRRLLRAFAVRICPKIRVRMAWPKWCCKGAGLKKLYVCHQSFVNILYLLLYILRSLDGLCWNFRIGLSFNHASVITLIKLYLAYKARHLHMTDGQRRDLRIPHDINVNIKKSPAKRSSFHYDTKIQMPMLNIRFPF